MDPKKVVDAQKQELLIRMRRSAFVAVVLSTVAILSCVIGLPLSYSYVQQIQSSMYNEIEFCKVQVVSFIIGFILLNVLPSLLQIRNRDLWNEVMQVQIIKGYPEHWIRLARQSGAGGYGGPPTGGPPPTANPYGPETGGPGTTPGAGYGPSGLGGTTASGNAYGPTAGAGPTTGGAGYGPSGLGGTTPAGGPYGGGPGLPLISGTQTLQPPQCKFCTMLILVNF